MTSSKHALTGTRLRISALLALAALLGLAGCSDSGGGGGGGGGGSTIAISGTITYPAYSTGAFKIGLGAVNSSTYQLVATAAGGTSVAYSFTTSANQGQKQLTFFDDLNSNNTADSAEPGAISVVTIGGADLPNTNATLAVGGGSAVDTTGTGGSSGSGGTTFSCTTAPSLNDPLFPYQWYLHNTGQTAFATYPGTANEDIHLCDATQRGVGIVVAVVDTGAEKTHEDLTNLVAIVAPTTSHNFDPAAPDANDPTNSSAMAGDHGTSVSGIVAATSGNGTGISGVAGGATLVAYNLLGPNTTGTAVEEAQSLGADPSFTQSQGVHIFNLSWGYDLFDALNVEDLNPDAEANFRDGVTLLRGGKGALYIKAAGNGFGSDYEYLPGECFTTRLACQNANLDPYNTLPYPIVAGAVNALGVRSSYSTAGSALWVSAPGGEYGYDIAAGWAPPPANPHEAFEPAIVTTDQSGCTKGYSVSAYFDSFGSPMPPPNAFEAGGTGNTACSYTSTFNGSSSAAPVVSGVVALLLEANPSLTWRDVKHILAATSEPIDAAFTPITIQLGDGPYIAEPGWVTNGAGYHFHNWYGFGRVHVQDALALAATYSPGSWPPLAQTAGSDGFVAGTVTTSAIPDHSGVGASGTVTLSSAETGGMAFIEAVQVGVNITHAYAGDVGIEVTSPSGTRSVLLNIRSALGASKDIPVAVVPPAPKWVALSNAFYGENPTGDWTIKVVDGAPPDAGTLNSWAIRIYGH